mgnify:CR=1 FL=1
MNIIRFADLCAQGKVQGQRVFIRADLNVPFDDHGHISEDTRIRASVPCIQMALAAGAAVMVTSHLGRPTEGEFKPEDSLAPVAKRLGELLGREVPVLANWVGGVQVAPGQVVMLENCRVNKGEKKNSEDLARKMAALCDIFVHDAFGTAHRAEGTTYGIAQFAPVACAGPLLAAEIDAITKALAKPKRPLLAIVAGAKVSTKLSILQALAKNVDGLIVGGGIANTFLLAEGLPIGKPQAYDAAFTRHQIAGGVLTTTRRQLAELGLEHRFDEVMAEVERVRYELGSPIMVTPFPQIVSTQALFNVIGSERYGNIPDQVIRYVLGRFGRPTAPVNQNVLDRIHSLPRTQEILREPATMTLVDKRKQFSASMSDEEFLLRAVMPADQVDAMSQNNVRGYYYNPALQGVLKLLEQIKARPRVTQVQVKKGDFTLSLASHGDKA